MAKPVEIAFQGMEGTEALRADIHKHVDKLTRIEPRIIKCTVVVKPAEHHHHKGNRFEVDIRLTLPGGELDVGHTPSGDRSHEDAYVAVRDAFKAMRRRLQDFRRKHQGKVKHHEEPPGGWVRYIDREAGYGVIETLDGRDIHFHRNCLVDAAFEKVRTGDKVRFTQVPGDEKPWASTVHLLSRRHQH